MSDSSELRDPSDGCHANSSPPGHIEALRDVLFELDEWDMADSEVINGGSLSIEEVQADHPLHTAIVNLNPFYPGKRLPIPVRRFWQNFLGFTREKPATRESVNSALAEKDKLWAWVNSEILAKSVPTESPSMKLDDLPESKRKAYEAYLWAEGMIQESMGMDAKVTDRQAYAYAKENGLPDEFGTYSLPSRDTFERYCQCARNKLGSNKNHRREKPTANGKSIIAPDQCGR